MSKSRRARNRNFRQKLKWHLFLKNNPQHGLYAFEEINIFKPLPWWVHMTSREQA